MSTHDGRSRELCGVLNDQLSGINWRATRDSGRKRAFLKAALDVVDYLKQPEPDLAEGKPTLAQRYADTARKLAQAYSNCSRSIRPEPSKPRRAPLPLQVPQRVRACQAR